MNNAIVKLKPNLKGTGWGISVRDKLGNTYSISYARRYIELPVDAAKKLEGDSRIDIEYPGDIVAERPIESKEETKPIVEDSKKFTKSRAMDLSKNQQIALLKKLGAKVIPRKEAGRVKLILTLQ